METNLIIRGARVHNLKNINLDIPRQQLVVFSGVSGSGKSSLVFDTLYTEAQRQLIDTFSTFAQRRMPKLSRPDVDVLQNLGTAIVIDQKRLGKTLRSTVGTATEIHTYLRLLWSRCAQPFIGPSFFFSFNNPEGMCPQCQGLGKQIRVDVRQLIDPTKTLRTGAVTHPDFKVGGYFWRDFTSNGLFDIDQKLEDWSEESLQTLLYAKDMDIQRTHQGVAYSKKWEGLVVRLERLYVQKGEDEVPEARKDAYQQYLTHGDCEACHGDRLNARAIQPLLGGKNIAEVARMELTELDSFLASIHDPVAMPLVRKMRSILGHLIGIGAGYLNLNRAVATLSGGESQRVKMARQLDCNLVGLMYVLDEPSVGLHSKDTQKLLDLLYHLRDQGNSILVVEHDPEVIQAADHVIEIGPRAGKGGGEVIFAGSVSELWNSDCATGTMLRQSKLNKGVAPNRRKPQEYFEIRNACSNNLQHLDVNIPKCVLCCITGVAGSGKSSLVHGELVKKYPAVVVDQQGVARNSRSNALTYTGIFDGVRKEFAHATGALASLFSFNSQGACPECKGQGFIKLEMSFLDDVVMPCSRCEGQRYKPEVLELRWKGKNINDVLNMTVLEALDFFTEKRIIRQLNLLNEVGLGYLELGQPLGTLSGGEAQRLKLAGELNKKGNLYVLDEPTTGLHLADIERLMVILQKLVNKGNSVVVIEHNLELARASDYLIDMGPEGGARGGRVLAQGTPEEVARNPQSVTGRYLGL